MSDKQNQGQQSQTAKKKPASKPAGPALAPAEAMLQTAAAAPVGMPADLPNQDNSRSLRQAQFIQLQRLHGNAAVQRLLAEQNNGAAPALNAAPGSVQREAGDGGGEAGGEAGGGGLASITGATVRHYDVSGSTLDRVSPQLNGLDGFAAGTRTEVGIPGDLQIQRQGRRLRVEVEWVINEAVVTLPRWINYETACPAAQQEWDRFMGRARQHEQEAHVDAARQLVANLPARDRVITGRNPEQLQERLQTKQAQIRDRLHAMHERCDHGASIDATLHPDAGRCGGGRHSEEGSGNAPPGSQVAPSQSQVIVSG